MKTIRQSLRDSYYSHLKSIRIPSADLLEWLQDESTRFKHQVSEDEVFRHIRELIDAHNAKHMDVHPETHHRSHWSPTNSEDVIRCIKWRLGDLGWKINSLKSIPGHELELGFAYLERELLEDFLYKDE